MSIKQAPISQPSAAHCSTCAEIAAAVKASFEESVSSYIGSVEELFSTKCEDHIRLLELLLGSHLRNEPDTEIMLHKFEDPYVRLFAELDNHDWVTSAGFSLVRKDSAGYGRILDPCKIDSKLIREWKTECDTIHGDKCSRLSNAAYLPPASPNWLIDVRGKCIVPAERGMPYVALSYVWGRCKQLRALQCNLDELQKRGVLDSTNQEFAVPRTVQDAMSVVMLLDEKYLWVDALCIVQDDLSTRDDQLNNMAAIYAEAAVTIIAKDGEDSSFGLRGLPGTCRREYHQDIVKLNDDCEVAMHKWTVDEAQNPWSSRGWTFQEGLFSPRRLVFQGQIIRWECNTAIWHEDHDFNSLHHCNDPDDDRIFRTSSLFITQFPGLKQYGQLIAAYNKRQFTYSSDAVNAFAGITSSLSSVFIGGFCHGIPIMFFDAGLLWQPQRTLTRRTPNQEAANDTSPPSWSWAGWQGEISTSNWEHSINQSNSAIPLIVPTVEWYIGCRGQRTKCEIKNACSFPSMRAMGDLLSCHTERCFLYIGERHWTPKMPAFFSIQERTGRWAGVLRSHEHCPLEKDIPTVIGMMPSKGEICELVSISEGYADNTHHMLDEWHLKSLPELTLPYQFYNVLWIQWQDGIAYRRALGRVAKEVWQKQQLDRIELTLG